MNLNDYVAPLRRWWWLLAAATLLAAVSSAYSTLRESPIYQAQTTLMIGRIIDDPNPNQGELNLAQQLAFVYVDMVNRGPIRNTTMKALEMNQLPEYRARALPNSQLIEITVTDVNPLRAQVVANELANQLILQSPTGSRTEDQDRREFIESQLNDFQAQIVQTQDEIAKLNERLGTLDSARQLQETQNQITALQTKLSTLQGNYAALLSNTQQGATNTLTVVRPADLPSTPIGPNRSVSILLSTAIGFTLAAGAVYLREYLDNTLRTPEEISRILGVPVIGYIGEAEESEHSGNGVYVSRHPLSPIAEAYRSLKVNIESAGLNKPLKTILISSAEKDQGKTSVAANLAVVLAQGEKKVILVDADLRRSGIHSLIDLSNELGLSNILQDGLDLSEALQIWQRETLKVVTSGSSTSNPAEILSSQKMDTVLNKLRSIADVVILDSPPLLVADSLILSTKVDGVLMVIRPGCTRKKVVQAMMEQLTRVGANVIGVVLSRIPKKDADYYGGYLYYSPYYADGFYRDGKERSKRMM